MEWLRKIGTRLTRARFDEDLAAEMEAHMEERRADLERSGRSPGDARAQAQREFGRRLTVNEDSAAAWHLGWIEDLFHDLRYAWRALRRDRAFALTAVASLALGIGVNTAMFSLAAEFLFSEPSVRDSSRILTLRLGGNSHADPAEYRFLQDMRIFESLAGYREGEVNLRLREGSKRLFALKVSRNYFSALGVPLLSGRPIQEDDRDVVIVSNRFWKNTLNGDGGALGRTLTLDGRAHAVIGILPADHRTVIGFGLSPDVYLVETDVASRLALLARLPEGMARSAAFEHLRVAANDLDRVQPEADYKRSNDLRLEALAGIARLGGENMLPVASFFALLMIVVSLILALACANVVSLLLARASARSHELAIRASIGAGRGRLLRHLLAESLLLALLGTAAGVALNLALMEVLNRIRLPLPVPIYLRIEPGWRLLAYCAGIAIAVTLATGLLPALESVRRSSAASLLNRATRQLSSGSVWRSVLVTGQVAVSCLVLTVAFLFLRNLGLSSAMSPGFDVSELAWASMRLVPERYPAKDSIQPLLSLALERVRSLPGTESAALLRVVPFNDQESHGGAFQVDDEKQPKRFERVYNRVSTDYFRTMGIPLVAGREFTAAEVSGDSGVAIVNEEFASRLGGKRALGRRLRWRNGTQRVIVGICRNMKFMTIGETSKPALYEPFAVPADGRQHLFHFMIRARSSPAGLTRQVDRTLLDLDSTAAVETKPMASAMGLALLPSQVGALLLGSMGFVGVTLASIGLYGILVYSVARRQREIGVRRAVGAQAGDILKLVLRDAIWIMGAGITLGLGAALFITQPLAAFLVEGLRPADPASFFAVTIVLSVVAIAASVAPAMRALGVDPNEALRRD